MRPRPGNADEPLGSQLFVRLAKDHRPIAGEDNLPGTGPAVVVTGEAVPIEDRLNLTAITEQPRRVRASLGSVLRTKRGEPRPEFLGLTRQGAGGDIRRGRRVDSAFVTADAGAGLAGTDHHPAAHRLDHHLVFVENLEIEELLGRYLHLDGAVRLDRNGPKDPLVREVVPVHPRRLPAAILPLRRGPIPLFGGFDHPQVLDRPGLDVLHPHPLVEIRDGENAGGLGTIDPLGYHHRCLRRDDRHRVKTALGIFVQRHHAAVVAQRPDRHLLLAIGAPRSQKQRIGKGIRVFKAGTGLPEGIVKEPLHQRVFTGRVDDPIARLRRPGHQHRFFPVGPQPAVDQRRGSPGTVMAGAKDGDEFGIGTGKNTGVDHAAGGGGVVPPEEFVFRPVGIRRPKPLRVAEVAVDVLPAVVEDPPVGEQAPVPLEEGTFADLLDIGPVVVHHEQIAHNVTIAHAVLRLARRGEQNPPVGEVDRVDIRNPP